MRTRLKVCCISSQAEARLALAAGADALGLVSAMPSGPGPIPDDLIALIAAAVAPPVATVLLTSLTDADAIAQQAAHAGVNTVQLVDHVEPDQRRRLHAHLPHLRILQVVHVVGPESLDDARQAAQHAHALLLDSGNPAAPIKELGGTGRAHDWATSARIVQASDLPVFLAGGLHAANAAAAIATVRPYALDVCSGVRTHGRLDPQRLSAFAAAIR